MRPEKNALRLLCDLMGLALLLIAPAPPVSAQNCIPGQPQLTLDNPAPGSDETFGSSMAISGDLLVIGVPGDSPTGLIRGGSAYVFDAVTGSPLVALLNPAPGNGDTFGYSVAISGNRVAVGAIFDSHDGQTRVGAAYVFDATNGALVSTLKSPDPGMDDFFGESVAIAGDATVVGASGDDPGGVSNAGSAYVFNTTTGANELTLTNPAPADSDFFGHAVAIAGKFAVVGAYGKDVGGNEGAGIAYIFNLSNGALVRTLNNPEPAPLGYMGRAVAASGNLVAVGALASSSNEAPARVYIFHAIDGQLLQTLHHPMGYVVDEFGASISISGNSVIVGARSGQIGGVAAGSAWHFLATTAELLARIDHPFVNQNDVFGHSVAISNQIIAIGAPGADFGDISNVGAGYTFVNCDYASLNRLVAVLLGSVAEPEPVDDINRDGEVDVADLVSLLFR